MIWSTIKMGRKMRSVLLRNRKSGYTTTITPYKEDSEYWYVIHHPGQAGRRRRPRIVRPEVRRLQIGSWARRERWGWFTLTASLTSPSSTRTVPVSRPAGSDSKRSCPSAATTSRSRFRASRS